MELMVRHELCSGCRACLLACSLANFQAMTPTKAALRIEAWFPAPGVYQVLVCNQCGLCAEICPEEAIYRDGEVFVIRPDDCTGCGVCQDECPNGVIGWLEYEGRPIKCTGCGECALICPRGAIISSGLSAIGEAS